MADMADDNLGIEKMRDARIPQDDRQQQVPQEQPQVNGIDWEKAVAERGEKNATLEVQVAEATKNAVSAL